ncbi:MAG: hypothetical protein PVSMB7_02280 [Chloroflexota bacterium]
MNVPSPSTHSRHVVAYRTDVGTAHRVNQDSGGGWTWIRPDGTCASLLVVADGVSAGRNSEEASRLATDILFTRLKPVLTDERASFEDVEAAMIDAARAANHDIAIRPHDTLMSADATTLVAACLVHDAVAGIWCGDSRVYVVEPERSVRLTRDHSWAEHAVHTGLVSAERAALDPRAHMITRWLGPPEQEDPGIEAFRLRLRADSVLLCCSDGLYGYYLPTVHAHENEMATILFDHRNDLQGGVDELVRVALERGGRDNITASAVKIESSRVAASTGN